MKIRTQAKAWGADFLFLSYFEDAFAAKQNKYLPHHPQNHIRRDGHFGDGAKAFTNPCFRHLAGNPQFQCKENNSSLLKIFAKIRNNFQ